MNLNITEQCKILDISRSSYYYQPKVFNSMKEITFVKAIREELLKHPFYGYRKIAKALEHLGITEKQVRRLMRKNGLRAIYPKKNLSAPCKQHKKFPYLLKGMNIWLPNQVWATDITYINLNGKHVFLVAILDLFSRKVLSWSLSNTLDVNFCIATFQEATDLYGSPAIFNSDQGSQFTSNEFISELQSHNIRISMDGKGRALDNIYVERLWRSLKYEEIYLNSYASMAELKEAVNKYFHFYNTERFHQSLEYAVPDEIYYKAFGGGKLKKVA